LWTVIGLPYGSHRLRASEQAWTQGFVSQPEFDRRYPRRDHTPAALRLDASARQLGIYLATTDADISQRHAATTPELDRIGVFVTSVRERASDGALAVPPAIGDILRDHASAFDGLEGTLLAGDPVSWRSNKGVEIAVSLLGFRRIHEALLARSLAADQRGDRAARERSIEAAWRLEDSLHERPVLIDRLIVYAAVRSRNACLRRFPSPPPAAWLDRIRPAERLPALVDIFQGEAVAYCRGTGRLIGFADADELLVDDLRPVGPGGWLFRVGTAPVFRVGVAQYADLLRRETEALRTLDPCALDGETYTKRVENAQPYWNVVARTVTPTTLRTWWSARDTALDDELTMAVLAQRGNASTMSVSRPSLVCPGLTWRSTRSAAGITVHAEGEHTADLDAAKPGLRYTITKR
jgi:hypothetical protein